MSDPITIPLTPSHVAQINALSAKKAAAEQAVQTAHETLSQVVNAIVGGTVDLATHSDWTIQLQPQSILVSPPPDITEG